MDEGVNGGLVAWLIDAAAAMALAAAAGTSGLLLMDAQVGMLCASVVLVFGLWSLRQVTPEPIVFKVAALAPVGWNIALSAEADDADCLDLTVRAGSETVPTSTATNVACLELSLPTPGEMQRRIERHLSSLAPSFQTLPAPGGQVVPIAADASAALRSALGDLRRSTR